MGKFGDPTALQEYQGGRDIKALRMAAEAMGPKCGYPENIEYCTDEEKAKIEKYKAMPISVREELIEEWSKEEEKFKGSFKTTIEGMAWEFEEVSEKKDRRIAKRQEKSALLKLAHQWKYAKEKEEQEEEEMKKY